MGLLHGRQRKRKEKAYQCECGHRSGVALELHSDLDGKIAQAPVELGKRPTAP